MKMLEACSGAEADPFVDLVEDLFDCVDPQTAFVLEAIFDQLIEKIALVGTLNSDEVDLKYMIMACRDTVRDVNTLPESHELRTTRVYPRRVLN